MQILVQLPARLGVRPQCTIVVRCFDDAQFEQEAGPASFLFYLIGGINRFFVIFRVLCFVFYVLVLCYINTWVRSFRYQICEHYIFKPNEPISMQISTNGLQRK